jgi:pyruvate/2-oxoacid:ferredoxin oxidoreductase alpha subunit
MARDIHGVVKMHICTITFAASKGIFFMIPNMLKIAGESIRFCMRVVGLFLATNARSIFTDDSDVLASSSTSFAFSTGPDYVFTLP